MVHVKYPLFVIIFKINFYYITYHRLYLGVSLFDPTREHDTNLTWVFLG